MTKGAQRRRRAPSCCLPARPTKFKHPLPQCADQARAAAGAAGPSERCLQSAPCASLTGRAAGRWSPGMRFCRMAQLRFLFEREACSERMRFAFVPL